MNKFIMTQDVALVTRFEDIGYKPLVNSGGFYIFENNPELIKICLSEFDDAAFVLSNKMFI